MAEEENPRTKSAWTPVPDPTLLTTEALEREIRNLKEILLRELGHTKDLSEEKFRGVEAKFDGIDDKFQDVARRTAEQKSDTKGALDAALAAQKEWASLQTEAFAVATDKSERATTKQIDALAVLVDKSDERRGDEITDLKNRIVALETSRQNQGEGKIDNRGSLVLAVMIGSSIVGLLGFIAAVVALVVNIIQ